MRSRASNWEGKEGKPTNDIFGTRRRDQELLIGIKHDLFESRVQLKAPSELEINSDETFSIL